MSEPTELQKRWKYLYHEYLPQLAKSRDPCQPHWPVNLDHCFARIVLDNAVGIDRPWTEVVKSPAIKHMTTEQIKAAIELIEKFTTGEADLVQLDNQSLELRGKKRKSESSDEQSKPRKKARDSTTVSSYFLPSPKSPSGKSVPASHKGNKVESDTKPDNEPPSDEQVEDVDMSKQLKRIEDSDITAFRKKTLTLLCQVPRGRYSTYQAMSDYITKTSHKTCARAIGSAMRNNPFAPEVPCHRILANDGSLGGFNGHWGENGKFASKKHELLYEEGVRFDSRGKVKGPPFRAFTT